VISRFIMLVCVFCTVVSNSYALDLELTQGMNTAMPIGINYFGTNDEAQSMVEVIHHDLSMSGQFKVITAPIRHGEQPLAFWKRAGADSVLSGRVIPTDDNLFNVSIELIDSAVNGRLLFSKKYQVNAAQLRSLAHHISDEVYLKLTGEQGIFSTRIAYILVKRGGDKAKYSLEVADMDGNNAQSLLESNAPIMSPTWSPDGSKIAYVSFEKKRAQVFSVNVETGNRRLLTDFSGINGAPAWSPDGKKLAVVLSKSGSPKIYTVSLANGDMKQLTFGESIDTEPEYAPDGKSIIFTSGRGGSPQIYSLTLANGKVNRISFDGNYNASASYTPNQKSIVMLHREDRQFNIGVQNIATGIVTLITDSDMDESPSISPNGRLVLYATTVRHKGILAMSSIDGRIKINMPSREGDVQEPSWSPFSKS
jgi:TolB protein